MGALTLQIMILVASFLFYRILKTGFDSWKAILIDFGIVIFLFGLQYYLQEKQNKMNNSEIIFPAGPLSTFFGTSFPAKIATQKIDNSDKVCLLPQYGNYLQLSSDHFFEPKQKRILNLTNNIQKQKGWSNNKLHIPEDSFYIVQMSCNIDIVPYAAKLSIQGEKNQIEKSIHNGENSFVVYLKGEDHIFFEVENQTQNIMLQDTTTLYVIRL